MMNYNHHSMQQSPGPPGIAVTPLGWKAEWSAQYSRYFYVNINTKESTWTLPASPPLQQVLQAQHRKPVSNQASTSPSQVQSSTSTYIENYSSPPPQINTGYFPSQPSSHQQQPQSQYIQQQQNPQQQYSQASHLQQSGVVRQQQYSSAAEPQYSLHAPQKIQYSQPSVPVQQQPPSPSQYYPQVSQNASQQTHYVSSAPSGQQISPSAIPVSYNQQQQHNYPSPTTTSNSTYPSSVPQIPSYPNQAFSPPPTPNAQNPQQPSNTTPPGYSQQSNVHHSAQFVPQPQSYSQQANNFTSSPQQPHGYQNQLHPQQHLKQSSIMGGNLMNGNMMNKMSSKFTQLQKGVTGPPSTAHPNAKPTDWKKWAKRGAIGVAGIGALALGVDAAGDMFSGAEGLVGGDFSGGSGDFSGGEDFSGGGDAMDAQTALDANAAQLNMELAGQDNAQMLLDPEGTTYTAVNDAAAAQASMGLI